MLLDTLTADLVTARRNQHEVQTSVLRIWISECDAARGRNKGGVDLTDSDVEKIGRKILKNMNESYELTKNRRYLAESQEMGRYIKLQDDSEIDYAAVINTITTNNPEKEINEKTVGWFVGQVMKETGGKANPATVKQMLLERV